MHPHLELGPLSLRTWSVVVTVGVCLCWPLVIARAGRLGYSRRAILLWLVLAFPIGALAATAAAALVARVQGVDAHGAGMTVLGSLAGVLLFSVAWARLVFRQPAGPLLDAAAFTLPLAMVFGRIGCLFHGCCFGRPVGAHGPSVLSIAVDRFSSDSAAAAFYATASAGARIWNFPLLLAAQAVVVLGVAEHLYRRRERYRLGDGVVLCAVLALDSAGRFFIEFTRADAGVGYLGVNPWQWLSGLVAIAAAIEASRRSSKATIPGRRREAA